MFKVKILNVLLFALSFFVSCNLNDNPSIYQKEYNNDMILVPSGSFDMGNTGAYMGSANEKPVHYVKISKQFYMSKYEITQQQYYEIMLTNPSRFYGDNLPVETVSWNEAINFCNLLSLQEGFTPCYAITDKEVICNFNANGYRLPTEAEWEYACKAGSTTDFYSGDLIYYGIAPLDPVLDKIAWYRANSDEKTHFVGQKAPNDFGLYDMSGNVAEWCWDIDASYKNSAELNPHGVSSGPYRIYRGGSWYINSASCRSSDRFSNSRDFRFSQIGFRIVRNYAINY